MCAARDNLLREAQAERRRINVRYFRMNAHNYREEVEHRRSFYPLKGDNLERNLSTSQRWGPDLGASHTMYSGKPFPDKVPGKMSTRTFHWRARSSHICLTARKPPETILRGKSPNVRERETNAGGLIVVFPNVTP